MRLLLLCAATFAAGLLVGALFWPEKRGPRSGGPAAPDARSLGRAPYRPGGAERSDRAPNAGETAAGARGGATRVDELAREAKAEIDEIFSSEQAASVLSGDGTISGTVRDTAGKPVAGVFVTAQPEARPFGLAAAGRRARARPHVDRDLADVAGFAIEGEFWRRQSRRVATTKANGRFEIEGLMDARHNLTAYHDDYDVRPVNEQQNRIAPDAVVDFLARPIVEVPVEVRRPDGTVAENAWLTWQAADGDGTSAWTADTGAVRLPVGSVRIRAQTWVPEPLQSEVVEHAIGPDSSERVLVLELAGRRVLSARLVLPEGFTTPDKVECRLRLLGDEDEPDPQSLLRGWNRARPGARAVWFDLEPGRYLVAAFLEKRRLLAHAIAEVGEGATEIELVAEEIDTDASVVVALRGPEGGPVVGNVTFHVVTGDDARTRYHETEALPRSDGTFVVFFSDVSEDAREATVRAYVQDYGSAQERFNPQSPGTVNLRLRQPARLKVRVDGFVGSGLETRLWAHLQRERVPAGTPAVQADGTADFGWVQPGDYTLHLVFRTRRERWSVAQRRITLTGGEQQQSIAVPVLHVLRVRPDRRLRVREVVLRSKDTPLGLFRRRVPVNREGLAVFADLAAGSYEVQCGRRRMRVQVPGPDVVRVE